MKGFTQITAEEQFMVIGGKDSDVAKFVELLGYSIGMIVRMIKNWRKGSVPKEQSLANIYPF
jgi:hypothetical protein